MQPISPIIRIPQKGASRLFMLCDHATNALPEEYAALGLSPGVFETHIAYDIGARGVAERLCAAFGAPGVFAGFSRLLIDPHRGPDQAGLIVEESDGVSIPGNQGLTEEQREDRIARFYDPYHAELGAAVTAFAAATDTPLFVSIHSFTPRVKTDTEDRPWHYGVLWRDDPETARATLTALREEPGIVAGDNEPYSGFDLNYTANHHLGARGLRHVLIEVRQDLVADNDGMDRIADQLTRVVRKIL